MFLKQLLLPVDYLAKMDDILVALQNVEKLAEEILIFKQEMIDLDKKRQKNRESLNGIRNRSEDKKLWICSGNMFIKTKTDNAIDVINRDQNAVNNRLNELRAIIKQKMNELRVLEGNEELKGFDLKALSKHELNAIQQLL